MPTYIVTHKQTGHEVYRYESDATIEWAGMEFATHDHGEFTPSTQEVPLSNEPRRVTRLAFRNRFTASEKVALEISALDTPAASMEQRAGAASLRAYMADVNAATFIDLTNPGTRSGVQTLEAFGLIAPGRALEILDTAPAADEVFNG